MHKVQSGFSTIELLVVVAIIAILSAVTIIGFSAPRRYGTDNQVMKLVDAFQDARQKALVENSIMRVEIDKTKKEIRLIDENVRGNASDDVVVRKIPFETTDVNIDTKPKNVSTTKMPTASSPIPEAAYKASVHPLSLNNQVMTFRFQPDGQVVNAGTNAAGSGAIVTGATVFVYDKTDGAGYATIVRAATLIGFTGASNIVKCQMDAQKNCTNWLK
jgi:prepilin-type N-terminal cleavage/methylation domain-containing protein